MRWLWPVGLLLLLLGLDAWSARLETPPPGPAHRRVPEPAVRLQVFEDVLADPDNREALRQAPDPEVRRSLKALHRALGRALWAEIRVLQGLDPAQAQHLFELHGKVEHQPLIQGMPVERLVQDAHEAFPVGGATPPDSWSLREEEPALRRLAVRFESLAEDPDETDRVWRRLLSLRPRGFLFAALRLRPGLRARQTQALAPYLRALADETLAYETQVDETDAVLRRAVPALRRPMDRHAPLGQDAYLRYVDELARD